jgi:hypothetical protein
MLLQGLSAEDCSGTSAPKTPTASKKKVMFRIYFPMPPFDGVHFNALKAGQGSYNFTVSGGIAQHFWHRQQLKCR